MKRKFTILIVSLFAVSLMGQSSIKNHRTEVQRSETFKILKQITRNNTNVANPFYSPNDSKQGMDSLIYEEYYEFDGGWKNDEKYEYYWDESGKETNSILSGWMVEDNQWLFYQKTDYSYDEEGRLLVMNTQQLDEVTLDWGDWSKVEFAYESSSAITAIMYMWQQELNQWLAFWKYEYVFDNNGKLLEIVNYYNNEVPENWLNGEKYEYIYNGDGRMVQELWWLWDMNINDWENEYKVDYSYEDNGNLISEIWNYWNTNTLEWDYESKAEYAYDEHGNISEYLESWWEFDLEDWLVEEKVDYTYNNAFVYSDLILPADYSGYFFIIDNVLFNHMLLTEEVFEAWDENWDEDSRTTYFYSEHNSSGVKLINDGGFLAYPNPATDFFTLNINNGLEPVLVEIYDNQGRMIASQEVVEGQPISITNLNAGVYIYKFVFNDKAFSRKLLIH